MCAKFQVNRYQFSIQKWIDSRQRSRGQNTPVGIGLTEITELSDILNYKPFFKLNNLNNAFYKLFYMHFKCVYLLGTKSFFPFFTFF